MAEKILVELGKNVKKFRLERGLSQEELAHRIGRDTRSVVAIENGKRNPTLMTIRNLCLALDLSSSDLLPF